MRGLSVWAILVWGMAFALLVANVGVSLYNIEVLIANDRAVTHSREVNTLLEDLVSAVKDEEIGQRGFIITGDDSYLDQYFRGEESLPGNLERLRELTKDDPFYQSRLGPLTDLINERRQMIRKVIEVFREDGPIAARRQIAQSRGKEIMDQIRVRTDEMEAHERAVLESRSATSKQKYQSSAISALLGGALTVFMIGLAFILVRIELSRRQTAEASARQAAEHLAASESRFRTLTEAIPQMVWNTDAKGRVSYFNRSWVEYTGLSAADAVESFWKQIAHPEDAPRVDAAWRNAISGQPGPFAEEVRIRDVRDGSYHWFQTSVAPLHRADGTIDQWIGSLSSIEEQKRQAEMLAAMVKMRTTELESANALLREEIEERTRAETRAQATAVELTRSNEELEKFAYVASHDLQEPLRKIQAFGDRLVSKYRGALGEDGREYIDRMKAAATRMRKLIDDLLAFSRVTTTAQPFSEIDLTAIVREVLDDLDERIIQTGARIELSELPRLNADPMQMRQLFQNLIGNALKFHEPDKPPVIAIQSMPWDRLPPDAEPVTIQGDGIRVSVSDNGIGFSQTYANRVFELFQRLHGRGDYEGTGIGLAICRKIVQRHGGAISVRSMEGEGTTFYIDLPISAP